jgi:Carbohydrate esterase, sialic acid-specific acetylesterase
VNTRPIGLAAAALFLSLVSGRCGVWDWYVLAGQSNMVGASSQPTPTARGVAYRPDDTWWSQIVDPEVHGVHDGKSRGSAWPEFAVSMGTQPGLIATAAGATCLIDWPTENRPGRWNPTTGDLYTRALEQWAEAGSPKLHAFLWYQGECDAQAAQNLGLDYATTYALYKAALLELGDAVARDFHTSMVVAPISLRWCRWGNPTCDPALFTGDATKCKPVHDATIDAAAEHSSIFLGPSSDDLRLMPDLTHVYDVNELGRRWASAVRQMQAPSP